MGGGIARRAARKPTPVPHGKASVGAAQGARSCSPKGITHGPYRKVILGGSKGTICGVFGRKCGVCGLSPHLQQPQPVGPHALQGGSEPLVLGQA